MVISQSGTIGTIIPIGMLRAMPRVKLSGYECARCAHQWVPRARDHEPRVCPRCKSPYWDVPRKNERTRIDLKAEP